jgi:hypothetical protein
LAPAVVAAWVDSAVAVVVAVAEASAVEASAAVVVVSAVAALAEVASAGLVAVASVAAPPAAEDQGCRRPVRSPAGGRSDFAEAVTLKESFVRWAYPDD